jgi:hypothetical protein
MAKISVHSAKKQNPNGKIEPTIECGKQPTNKKRAALEYAFALISFNFVLSCFRLVRPLPQLHKQLETIHSPPFLG